MKPNKRHFFSALAILVAAGLSGCSDSSSSPSNTDDQDDDSNDNVSAATADVRAIHAVTDGPAVNLVVDGESVTADAPLSFETASPALEVPADGADLGVEAIVPGSEDPAIIDDSFDLPEDGISTLVATGSAADDGDITPVLLEAPQGPLQDDRRMRVQGVHAAPNIGAVDIYITTPDNSNLSSVPPVTLELGEQASAELFPDGRRIRITEAGIENPDDPANWLFDSGEIGDYQPEDEVVIAVLDSTGAEDSPARLLLSPAPNGDDFAVVLDQDPAGAAQARGAHFVAYDVANPVDVLVNGNAIPPLGNLDFREFSPFVPTAPGTLDIAVLDDNGDPVVGNAQLNPEAGEFVTGYAVGIDDPNVDPEPSLMTTTDDLRGVATEARARIVHAASQAPAVDVYLDSNQQLTASDLDGVEPVNGVPIPFGQATGFLSLAPGDYRVLVTEAGTSNVIIGDPDTGAPATFGKGKLFTAVAHDGPNPGNNFRPFGIRVLEEPAQP